MTTNKTINVSSPIVCKMRVSQTGKTVKIESGYSCFQILNQDGSTYLGNVDYRQEIKEKALKLLNS